MPRPDDPGHPGFGPDPATPFGPCGSCGSCGFCRCGCPPADQADELHRRTWLLNNLNDYANALAAYCKNPYADPASCVQTNPPVEPAAQPSPPPNAAPLPPLPVVCEISGFRPNYHATVQFSDGRTQAIQLHDTLLPGIIVSLITPANVQVTHDRTTVTLHAASCGDQAAPRSFLSMPFQVAP